MIAGRGEEQLAITEVLDAARAGTGSVLCLIGEPGIGKSTLLDWACQEASDGLTVVRTTGVESDFAVPYAGLLDVATPLRQGLDDVPSHQRAALEGALGWAAARDGTSLLIAAAAMTLLSVAASRQPVLVIVDDQQWLDPESAQVLAFAARRLQRDPVVFLTARREGSPRFMEGQVIELRLRGLTADAAEPLLPGVAAGVRDELMERTAGNPLALLDAAAALTAAQRRGSATLPETAPVGERVLRGFRETVSALSESARWAVDLAAASHRVDAGALVEILREKGVDAERVLDEATEAGLVRVDGNVSFAHPLQRAAAWASATPAERRAAHRALASSRFLDPRVRLRHRIAATTGFDDALSQQIEEWRRTEHGRLEYARGADLLERAADLSSSLQRASLLRAQAAEEALIAGDLDRVRTLARAVLATSSSAEARSRVLLALGVVEEYAGSVPRSRELLGEAAEVGTGLVRVRALAELSTVGYRLGDPDGMASAAGRLQEVADPADAEQQMLASYVAGAAAAFGGRWDEAREPAAQALRLLETDPALRDDPRYLVLALTAGVWMGEPTRALEFVDRRERRARSTGAIGLLPFALTLLAGGAIVMGEHLRGFAYADEAVQLGSELGYVVDVSTGQELLAAQLAARGRHREATDALTEARRLATIAGVDDAAVQVELVSAFAALCRGDADEAVRILERRLAVDGGRLPNGDYELAVAPDLVEAYLAAGHDDRAAALAQRHTALHLDGPTPVPRAHARRLLGMTTPDAASAHAAFEAALLEHDAWPDPFEAARTRLMYGARLRRDGERRAARAQLTAARTSFEQLGFSAWAQRAERELQATGQRARRGPEREQALTAQEARVAMLVATGMTNREIAASLFLSPRTVEHHVTAALRKNGVRTRTELALALSSAGAPPSPPVGSPPPQQHHGETRLEP